LKMNDENYPWDLLKVNDLIIEDEWWKLLKMNDFDYWRWMM